MASPRLIYLYFNTWKKHHTKGCKGRPLESSRSSNVVEAIPACRVRQMWMGKWGLRPQLAHAEVSTGADAVLTSAMLS